MPSKKAALPETVEKPTLELIEVKAVRAFFIDCNKRERADLSKTDRKGRSFVGATKRINAGETCEIDRDMANKLQDAGVIRIVL